MNYVFECCKNGFVRGNFVRSVGSAVQAGPVQSGLPSWIGLALISISDRSGTNLKFLKSDLFVPMWSDSMIGQRYGSVIVSFSHSTTTRS